MKQTMKRIWSLVLCMSILLGNGQIMAQAAVMEKTTQMAATHSYSADEIVETVLARLDAEIEKRPVARGLTVDMFDMGIKTDSQEWKQAYEQIKNRIFVNDYNKTFFLSVIIPYKNNEGSLIRIEFQTDSDFKEESSNNLNWAKIDYYRALVDSEVEKALTLLTDEMSMAEKALILQNFLCMNTKYECVPYNHMPVGAFANGKVVCTGYARAYTTLLHAAGIECKVIESKGINHAWVMLKLEDGTWYHADPTWDDTDDARVIKYTYFLQGDEQYRESHISWDGITPVAGKNDAFKNYAFYDIGVMLNYCNGSWYYLEQGPDGSYAVKTEFDGSGEEKILLNDVAQSMVAYKEKLYYNSETKVYEYNPATGMMQLYYDISAEFPGYKITQFVLKHNRHFVFTLVSADSGEKTEHEIRLETTEWEDLFITHDTLKLSGQGEIRELDVTIVPFYSENCPEIIWRSEDTSVATVSGGGLVIARNPGTTTIVATTADGKEIGRCQVEVDFGVAITGFDIVEDTIVINSLGQTRGIDSVFTPNEAADHENLIWESADPSVAKVDRYGIVTSVYYGRTTITATTKDGKFTDSCEVVVDPNAISGMALSHQHVYMYSVGQTFQLTADLHPSTSNDKRILWSSSDETVATVDENGLVTITGGGACQITATALNGGLSRSCNIYAEIPDEWGVYPSQKVPATAVLLNIVKIEATKKYEKIQLQAIVEPMEATNKMIQWESSNPAVAIVDQNGLVTVVGKGNCVISATIVDGSCAEVCQISARWDQEEENQVAKFVERMYTIVLNRAADPAGLNDWVLGLIEQRVDGAQLVNGFVNSEEFVARALSDEDFIKTLYLAVLGRAADEAGLADWLRAFSLGYTRQMLIDGFVTSAEFIALCDSYGILAEITQRHLVTSFVERMYTVALGRAADATGLEYWVTKLMAGSTDGKTVVNGFVGSPEFETRGLNDEEFIKTLYRTILGREASDADVASWIAAIALGQTRTQIMNGFIESAEFAYLCDGYGISAILTQRDLVTNFVSRMYTIALGRAADAAGLNDWVTGLINGVIYGVQVADGFIMSAEFEARELSNEAYVQTLYMTFFNREASDADVEGWVDAMTVHGQSRRAVMNGFINSPEFEALCNEYGIIRGALSE